MDQYLSAFLGFCSGIAIFLFGMKLLSRTLEALSGSGKGILDKSSDNPYKGFLLGTGVSALIQSSSATTVAVVGLVNSGILHLGSAYPIIIGANLGTTATSWITALSELSEKGSYLFFLSPQFFAPIIAIISVFIWLFAKKKKARNVSGILLGASFLFIGMGIAGSAFEPLASTGASEKVLRLVSDPPFGIMVGILTSALLQSSSASVGVLQAMSLNTLIPYSAVIPLVMGQNVGTCASALISSVKGSRDSKRASLFHLYYNLAGVLILSLIFYGAASLKPFSFLTRDASSFGIALTHTIFNLASVIVLSPFSKYIGRLSELSVKGNEAVKITRRSPEPDYNTRSSPVERLGQVQLEFNSLLSDAADTASLSASLIYRNSDENSILDQIGTRVSLAERRINELDVFINETATSELTFNGRIRLSALRDMLPMLQNVFIISFAVSEELSESSTASVSNETFSRLSSLIDAYRDVMLLTAKAQSEDDTATAHRIIPFAEAILSALEDAGYERVELTNLSYKIASSVSFCSTVAAYVIRSHLGGSSFEMREYMRMYAASPEYSSIMKETRKKYSL